MELATGLPPRTQHDIMDLWGQWVGENQNEYYELIDSPEESRGGVNGAVVLFMADLEDQYGDAGVDVSTVPGYLHFNGVENVYTSHRRSANASPFAKG